ncbi:hypothetical protein F7D75_15270 [Prevotella copri]|uniref:Uncharacterized protein n=1 Tax=Segatella copri TaxID=165179 RepID=A0A5P0WLK2_9BACT|nr:hypothetical protein [Segatella copri]MQO08561.1 hypothetical protein [Segatella copri]MQP13059.1 hypothetical protein [Segatella copri]
MDNKTIPPRRICRSSPRQAFRRRIGRLSKKYRPPADILLHNRCWASAYQLLCKRTTAVVRPKI